MFQSTKESIDRLKRFTQKTGAIIPTVNLVVDDLEELDGLISGWGASEREIETLIRAKFAIDPSEDSLY